MKLDELCSMTLDELSMFSLDFLCDGEPGTAPDKVTKQQPVPKQVVPQQADIPRTANN